jgi:iron complex outermembrane recepter protein
VRGFRYVFLRTYLPFAVLCMIHRLFFSLLFTILFVCPAFVPAQTPIRGRIVDAGTANELVGASVTVKGTVRGTITDNRGIFALSVPQRPPFVVVVSAIGYRSKEYIIKPGQSVLNVAMDEEQKLGQEIISSASRMEESVLRSPVSVEKVNVQTLQASPANTVYESLGYLKGVTMSRQSVLFQSLSIRGFGSNGNVRVVQLSDGMDNQSPGLNFSVGNLVGISELDMESMELLPGAASALYGPNAVNGLLLMTSKSPFRYQGLSAQVKTGVMRASNRTTEDTPLYEGSIRYAKAFGNKFAMKVSASYSKATDWEATDYRNQSLSNGKTPQTGSPTDLDYDGVNIYGDASVNVYSALRGNGIPGDGSNGTSMALGQLTTTTIPLAGNQTLPQLTGLTPNQLFDIVIPRTVVTRPGYRENQLIDYTVDNLKLTGALHYRINNRIEAIVQASYGRGNTFYTAQERYHIRDFHLLQYKAELRGPTFYMRGYVSHEDGGKSYGLGTLGQGLNEAGSPTVSRWIPTMLSTYAQSAFQGYAASYLGAIGAGQTQAAAQAAAKRFTESQQMTWLEQARTIANQNQLQPGTPAFQKAYDEIVDRTLPGDFSGTEPKVGAKFIDRTTIVQGEFMFDFRRLINPRKLELLVGGNLRQYNLNSAGTLFALDDAGNEFRVSEYGGYVQAGRSFAGLLKLTGSLRYDKNQNFDGQFSPRLAAVLSLGKDRQHNVRASLQQGFRIPTLQAQYSDVRTPTFRAIGGLPFLKDRYNFNTNPVYTQESVLAFQEAIKTQPVAEAGELLEQYPATFKWNPELVQTIEVGYKTLLGQRLLIDAYYFYNRFLNFEGGQTGFQDASPGRSGFPLSIISDATRTQYTFPVNLPIILQNHGWAVGAELPLPANFLLGGNVAFNALINGNDIPQGFVSFFNTPKYQYTLSLANRNLLNSGVSFNAIFHQQDGTVWDGTFAPTQTTAARQTYVPGFRTLDAQISKKILPLRSIIKVGGTNLLNELYTQSWGTPSIGATYYISLTFDELLN